MAGINGVGRVGIRSYVAPASLSSIVTNGLVLNLDAGNVVSYPGTGTTWTDLSGNGNNGTLVNGTSYSSESGGTLAFDGINDYVQGPNLLYGLSKATLCGWVKKTSTTSVMSFGVMDSLGGKRIEIVWYLNGNLYGECGGNDNFWVNSLPPKIDTGWHFICFTYDGSQATNYGKVSLYFDGALLTNSDQYNTIDSSITVTGPLVIGNRVTGYSTGMISNIQIYNRALTSAEVLQNFDATKSRFGFAAPAPAQSYMLDTYGGAAAGFSLRRLSSAYAGSAIRVRRSSDNTEMNIGFDSSGNLDTTSLTSFVGSGNGFVTTWYDQSGLGRDAIQPSASNQPEIVMSGVINTLNGKPAIKFIDYLSRYLYVNSTTVLNIQDCISTFSVANFVNNGGNYGMIMSKGYGVDGGYSLCQQANGSNYLQLNIETNSFLSTTITNKNQQYLFSNTNATGANGIKLYQNNSLIIQNTTSNDLTGSNSYYFNIGRNNRDNSYHIDGNIQEIVCYPTYQQTNLSPINANINTYYSIY